MRKVFALGVLVLLPACGGGGSSPTQITTTTTTIPPVNYSGAYLGNMVENVNQQAQINVRGAVQVTHNGNSLDFGNLVLSASGFTTQSYAMGSATLNGNVYSGGTSYNSQGCGVINVTNNGRFAGNLINMTVTLLPASSVRGCDKFEIRGELSR